MVGNVKTEISSGLLQSEQELRWMQELASALLQAQAALLALDVERLEAQTERQQTLCAEWSQGRADTGRRGTQGASEQSEIVSGPPGSPEASPWPATPDRGCIELRSLALRIRDLNQIQAALLRRAVRALGILASLQTRFALTYARPEASQDSLTPPARNL
jgi:hypothetical protein